MVLRKLWKFMNLQKQIYFVFLLPFDEGEWTLLQGTTILHTNKEADQYLFLFCVDQIWSNSGQDALMLICKKKRKRKLEKRRSKRIKELNRWLSCCSNTSPLQNVFFDEESCFPSIQFTSLLNTISYTANLLMELLLTSTPKSLVFKILLHLIIIAIKQ